jgi:hypothetical protein
MKIQECGLDCCFRMWHWDGTPPDFMTDIPPERDELDQIGGIPFCCADKKEWERETSCPPDDEGYMGGVPMDCPIYQGEADPWN